MQKRDKDPHMGQHSEAEQSELSDVWQELLGGHSNEQSIPTAPADPGVPTLDSDPWRTLLQGEDVEVVDLQRVHLKISAQEMERMLQVMQDQSAQDQDDQQC